MFFSLSIVGSPYAVFETTETEITTCEFVVKNQTHEEKECIKSFRQNLENFNVTFSYGTMVIFLGISLSLFLGSRHPLGIRTRWKIESAVFCFYVAMLGLGFFVLNKFAEQSFSLFNWLAIAVFLISTGLFVIYVLRYILKKWK